MKKLLFLLFLLIGAISYGQIIPTNVLKLKSVTTTQRDALSISAGEWPIIYNSTAGEFQRWNGASWETWSADATTLSDGDYGDFTVASGVATIDAGVVTGSKIANGTITVGDISAGSMDKSIFANEDWGAFTNTGGTFALDANSVGTSQVTDGSLDETDLDASVNASLDLADSAIQENDSPTFNTLTAGNWTFADNALYRGWKMTSNTGDDSFAIQSETGIDTGLFGTVYTLDATGVPSATTDLTDKAYVDAQVAAGISDGDKGDITVSSSGAVWNIDAGVVGSTEVANNSLTADDIATSAVTTTEILNATIDEVDLDTSVNASLDLADSSTQPGDNISTLTNNSGFIANVSEDTTPSLGGDLAVATNEIQSTTDIVLQVDTDNNGTNKLSLQNDVGTEVFAVSETGVLTVGDNDYGDISVATNSWTLDNDVVAPAEIADGDFGAFTFTTGVAALDANSVGSSQVTDGSLDETDLDASTNASLDLADSAVQPTDSISGTLISAADLGDISVAAGVWSLDDDAEVVSADSVNILFTPAPTTYGALRIVETQGTYQGGYFKYDASTNTISIGSNGTADQDPANDVDVMYWSRNSQYPTIPFDNGSSGLAATTIAAAINELDSDIAGLGSASISDAAYTSSWDGVTTVGASKNALYDEMELMVRSDTTGVTGADPVTNMMSLTQSEYDAITPDTNTFYIVTDAKVSDVIQIACSDLTTDITTGTSKAYFRMPWAATLTDVRVSLLTPGTATGITVDINESGTTVLSTKLTTDATEDTSETAATAAVISDSSLADDAEITIDFDAVPTNGAGVIVTLYVDHD